MTEEMKKEYLKKNFVKPLSESLPLSCDYFNNQNIEQCISINENFANYINFDLKSITQDYINKKQTQSQTQHSKSFEMNYDWNFSHSEFNFELIDMKQQMKNSFFKMDPKIEFNIASYFDEIDNNYASSSSDFKNAVRFYLNK
jgi:hypothetical protein